MNISFNINIEENDANAIIDEINKLGIKTAIINGIPSKDAISGNMIQLITVLDCDRKSFNRIKNRKSVRKLITIRSNN